MTNVKIQPHCDRGNEVFICAYNESKEDVNFRIGAFSVYTSNGEKIQAVSDDDDNVHIYHSLNSNQNRYLSIITKQDIEVGMVIQCEVIEIKNGDTFPRPRNKSTFKFRLCESVNKKEWQPVE